MNLRTQLGSLCVLFLTATTLSADEPVQLRYKFSPEKPLVYHKTHEQHRTDKGDFSFTPAESGDAKTLILLQPVKGEVGKPQRLQLEVVEKPADEVVEQLKQTKVIEQAGFVRQDEEFLVTPLGEVDVDESTEVKAKKKEPNPGYYFDERAKQKWLQAILMQLPEKPVTVGESWTFTDENTDEQTTLIEAAGQPKIQAKYELASRTETTCTFVGMVEHEGRKVAQIDIERRSNGKSTISQSANGGRPFIPVMLIFHKSESDSGRFLFDVQRGELLTLETADKVTFELASVVQVFELLFSPGFSNGPDHVTTVESETKFELLR